MSWWTLAILRPPTARFSKSKYCQPVWVPWFQSTGVTLEEDLKTSPWCRATRRLNATCCWVFPAFPPASQRFLLLTVVHCSLKEAFISHTDGLYTCKLLAAPLVELLWKLLYFTLESSVVRRLFVNLTQHNEMRLKQLKNGGEHALLSLNCALLLYFPVSALTF